MGANRLVADSFGESRWMGAVENTRGIGDGEWKPSGVTAEPEVTTKVVNGELLFFSALRLPPTLRLAPLLFSPLRKFHRAYP